MPKTIYDQGSSPYIVKLSNLNMENASISGSSISGSSISSDSSISDYNKLVSRFVVLAYEGGQFSTHSSIDGTKWTLESTEASYNIGFAQNMFFAFGSKTIASTDGLTWAKLTAPSLANSEWSSVAYGNNKFVLVASDSNNVAYTNDPLGSWAISTTGIILRYATIVFGNNVFLTFGREFNSPTTKSGYSTDGITWQLRTMPATQVWRGLYGNNIFYAVTNTTTAATSTNGLTWTLRTKPDGGEVIYAKDSFFYKNGTTIGRSTDGIAWTTGSSNITADDSLSYANGFVTFDNDNSYTSTDGITWISHTVSFSPWGYTTQPTIASGTVRSDTKELYSL